MNRYRIQCRRGFTIVETMAAIALVSVAMVATAQVLAVCARQRFASQQLLAAELEAANVQERIAALAYEQITPSTLQSWELSPNTQTMLRHGKLQVAVTDSKPGEPMSKRVHVEVSWPQFTGERATDGNVDEPPLRVELTAWRFPTAAEVSP